MLHGHKCDFSKQIREELLDNAVREIIVKLVSNPKFAAMMQEKINTKVDTSAVEAEIEALEKQLRQHFSAKSRLIDEICTLIVSTGFGYSRRIQYYTLSDWRSKRSAAAKTMKYQMTDDEAKPESAESKASI